MHYAYAKKRYMGLNLEIEISREDARLILGDRFEQEFVRAVHTATCTGCSRHYNATIEVREIWLNHIGDLIVEGTCRLCGTGISKYIEASNFRGAFDQAMSIRELKIHVLKDYNGRLPGG